MTTITRRGLLQKQPQFKKYMYSNLISRFGDSLDAIATSWLIYEVTGDPSMSALVLTINMLPTVFFTPFLGAWIEKLNKKYVLCIVDFFRAAVVAFYAYGYLTGILNSTIILIMTFLISTIEAFGSPAVSSFIPAILEKEYYEIGVGTNKSLSGIMELLGTASAGIIISIFGVLGAFIIDIITFLISACIKLTIKYQNTIHSTITQKSYFILLKEGFIYLRKSKILMYLCFVAICLNCFLVPFNSFQVPYIADYLDGNANYLSAFSFSIVFGTIIGGYFYPTIAKKISMNWQLASSALTTAASYFGMAFFTLLPISSFIKVLLLVTVFFLLGISVGVASSSLSVIFMKQIETEYLSRASSIFGSLAVCAMPITSFLLSLLIRSLTIPTIFFIFTVFSLIIFVILKKDKTIS